MAGSLDRAERGLATLREIASQPTVWASVLDGLRAQDLRSVRPIDGARVIFTGCGSTHYLAQWAARRHQEQSGVISVAVPASDLLLAPDTLLTRPVPLLVVVSRSGETTESVRAAQVFKDRFGGPVVVVTCYPESSLADLGDLVVAAPEAQEESVAQTRTFTAMMLCCAAWIAGEVPDVGNQLRAAGTALLDRNDELARTLAEGADRRFFFLGSGALYGLANEAMLKMKEMSLSVSEGYHALEFRHGPMSVVDNRSVVVALLPEDSPLERAVLRDMRQLGATVMAVGGATEADADVRITLPSAPAIPWRDVLYLPLLQMVAWHRATQRDLDPDRPTNLTAVVVLAG